MILVDSVLVGGLYFQPCLFASFPPHPSWQCPWLLHEFLHPGCCGGPEVHLLGLGVSEQGLVVKQALLRHSFTQWSFFPQKLQVSLLLSPM